MTLEDYIRFASALILVLALMGLLALIVRKLNNGGGNLIAPHKRLSIIEQRMIDTKHKMVLVRRDDTEHLVILSQNGNTVIETGIKAPATAAPANKRNKKDIPLEDL